MSIFNKKQPEPKANKFEEIGVSGVNIQNGYVDEEFLPDLKGERARRKYCEMADNDAVIGAILYAIDMTIKSATWPVEASEDDTDEYYKEFVESIMGDMSNTWEDTISEIFSMLTFGWQYSEIVYKRRMGLQKNPTKRSKYNDGLIGIRKLAPRAQKTLDRWEIDDDGGIKGLWQMPPNGGASKFIPIERALLFRTKPAGGNPEGRSILRTAYKSYHYLTNIQNIESIAVERELAGLPVVRIPKEYLTDPELASIKNEYIKMARDLKFNDQGAVLIPSDSFKDVNGNPSTEKLVSIELMSASGSRAIDTNATIRRYQQDMAMSVLADFILLGMGDKGSFALSDNKTDMFTNSLTAYLNATASVFNQFMFPRLWEMNGFDFKFMPKVVPGSIKPVNLDELGRFISEISGAGMQLFPSDNLEDHIKNAAGLPRDD